MKPTIPRGAAFVLFALQIVLWYVAAPAAFAGSTCGLGSKNRRPSGRNLLGLVLLVPGFLCLGWCVYLHFARSPRAVEVPRTASPYLLKEGPYRWSRNPMYVSGVAIWMGWAVYYGSVAVLLVAVVFWSALAFLAIPFEEGQLEARWGEPYRRYMRAVPRWLAVAARRE